VSVSNVVYGSSQKVRVSPLILDKFEVVQCFMLEARRQRFNEVSRNAARG
jgi:hypothetical protein